MKKLNLTHYLMLGLFITLFLLLRQCGETKYTLEELDKMSKKAKELEDNVTIDTTYLLIKGKPDTIHDTVPRWYPKLVPVFVKDTTDEKGDSLAIYRTLIEDSLLKGELLSTVDGVLVSTDFRYTPKGMYKISTTDTLERQIDTKETVIKDPWEFYLGGVVGGSTNKFSLEPAFLLRVPKKNLMFGYGFDLIDQTHNIHIYTKIKWP